MFYFPTLGGINANIPMLANDRVYYINRGVTNSSAGASIDAPFKSFDDYQNYASKKKLTGDITLYVLDGGYYEDISFDNIVGNGEVITIYAPFATFKNVTFVGTGTTVHNHCRMYAGHVIGNVVMSQNSELYVTELGTYAGTNTTDTVSTAITFDTRQDNENVFINATNFSGSISVAGLVTAEINTNLYLDILQWGDDNSGLYNLFATNQAQVSNPLDIYIRGQVNGVKLPLQVPQFQLRYGEGNNIAFPLVLFAANSFVTNADYRIELDIQDVENVDVDNLDTLRVRRDVQGGVPNDNLDNASADITVTSATLTDHQLTILFRMTNAARHTSQPNLTPYIIELELPIRQYVGNSTHDSLNVYLFKVITYNRDI